MAAALYVAQSLGILFHAVSLVPFCLWIFGGGATKRWETGISALGAVAGIFAYVLAMVDSAESAYIAFAFMRASFELQRCVFLRTDVGSKYAAPVMIAIANILPTLTFDRHMSLLIVSFTALFVLYLLSILAEFIFRKLIDRKALFSLGGATAYAIGIIIVLALSPAYFKVMSETVEFFIYPFLDLILIVISVFHIMTFHFEDKHVSLFDYISLKDGTSDLFRAILLNDLPEQGVHPNLDSSGDGSEDDLGENHEILLHGHR